MIEVVFNGKYHNTCGEFPPVKSANIIHAINFEYQCMYVFNVNTTYQLSLMGPLY
jgi:hypothetical protein